MLLEFVDLFGHQLDATEADEYRVLRAHHVETADNQGFQGYTAPPAKRGDLDKIFALYLEALGGTALLVKTSPRFTARSLNVRLLAGRFIDARPARLVSPVQVRSPVVCRLRYRRRQRQAGGVGPGQSSVSPASFERRRQGCLADHRAVV